MVVKSVVSHERSGIDEIIDLDVLIERMKKLRALNRDPDSIGLTQYKWRSFSIGDLKKR